jgi:hypothetical protein
LFCLLIQAQRAHFMLDSRPLKVAAVAFGGLKDHPSE